MIEVIRWWCSLDKTSSPYNTKFMGSKREFCLGNLVFGRQWACTFKQRCRHNMERCVCQCIVRYVWTEVIGNNCAIVVGDNGTIVQNTLMTTTSVKESPLVVRSFTLSQNYPNPFNPTTTISFSLLSKSFVSLKVYDMLGREIATIASEEMSAGYHSRQWNAANMSSGIYFYRMQAGSYSETRKLVLLR